MKQFNDTTMISPGELLKRFNQYMDLTDAKLFKTGETKRNANIGGNDDEHVESNEYRRILTEPDNAALFKGFEERVISDAIQFAKEGQDREEQDEDGISAVGEEEIDDDDDANGDQKAIDA